jgi:2,3-bisphosphoglycerate-independent phosphoglycerate mutase
LSNHPNLDFLLQKYPHSLINASGKYVGLPINQMGNSEVGHLNIGAGRIVYTGLSIIDNSLKNNKFYKNQNLDALVNEIKRRKCSLHLICLVSKGGVHSSYNHIVKMLFFFNKKKIRPVIHINSDGRDTEPKSFIKLLYAF